MTVTGSWSSEYKVRAENLDRGLLGCCLVWRVWNGGTCCQSHDASIG